MTFKASIKERAGAGKVAEARWRRGGPIIGVLCGYVQLRTIHDGPHTAHRTRDAHRGSSGGTASSPPFPGLMFFCCIPLVHLSSLHIPHIRVFELRTSSKRDAGHSTSQIRGFAGAVFLSLALSYLVGQKFKSVNPAFPCYCPSFIRPSVFGGGREVVVVRVLVLTGV